MGTENGLQCRNLYSFSVGEKRKGVFHEVPRLSPGGARRWDREKILRVKWDLETGTVGELTP